MSPRSTHALHERGDLKHLAPVLLIGFKGCYLGGQLGALSEAACTIEDCPAYRFRSAHARRLELRERLQGFGVQADTDSR
jgi:hypothetical protein